MVMPNNLAEVAVVAVNTTSIPDAPATSGSLVGEAARFSDLLSTTEPAAIPLVPPTGGAEFAPGDPPLVTTDTPATLGDKMLEALGKAGADYKKTVDELHNALNKPSDKMGVFLNNEEKIYKL